MKYVLAGLAAVAAAAALFFRPPQIGPAAAPPVQTRPTPIGADASADAPWRGGMRAQRSPVPHRVLVYVAGAVRKPGVYPLAPDSRAVDALARAGGALPDADLVAVNLAEPLTDGEEIAVPTIGEAPRSGHTRRPRAARPRRALAHGHRSRRREPEAQAAASAPSLDLNTVDATALEDIPGIGPALAARIVAYRDENGPFGSIDELADVAGITPRLQDSLAAFVFVGR